MGFLKKFVASLATRYGVVASGDYEGSNIVLGNPPKAKVTSAYSFSQMIFLKNNEEVARLNIGEDIIDVEYLETIKFPRTGCDGYRCKITLSDGDTCNVDLFPSKVHILYNSFSGVMLKETREFFERNNQ